MRYLSRGCGADYWVIVVEAQQEFVDSFFADVVEKVGYYRL